MVILKLWRKAKFSYQSKNKYFVNYGLGKTAYSDAMFQTKETKMNQ